jgi:hypothetical protein
VVNVKTVVFLNVKPCSVVKWYEHFEETCYFHIQGHSSTLKIESGVSSEVFGKLLRNYTESPSRTSRSFQNTYSKLREIRKRIVIGTVSDNTSQFHFDLNLKCYFEYESLQDMILNLQEYSLLNAH